MSGEGLGRLTRRDAIAGAVAAACASKTTTPARAAQRSGAPPTLDGELRFDEATRSAAADDFGHLVHRVPEAVLLAGSGDDVATTIRWAAKRGRKLAPRGNGHSTFGRSQVEHGIVADLSRLRNIGAVEGERIVVEAGAKWSEVLGVTLAQGMTPPVLTDYLELSVGGTLVVGGVGGNTSAFGVQTDNVIGIEVVTGSGEKFSCSAASHSDLFNAIRAGLGQVGVITRRRSSSSRRPSRCGASCSPTPTLARCSRTRGPFARLEAAKRRFDPDHTLTPGYEVFLMGMTSVRCR
jgi:FAD/FMN-containing dehydrogenase